MRKIFLFVLIAAGLIWLYEVKLQDQFFADARLKPGLFMQIASNAFANGTAIPAEFTCAGQNINPGLFFSGVPRDAKSLALIVDDPDAPNGTFNHWTVYNIPPGARSISQNAHTVPGVQAQNSAGQNKYMGPCPPAGTHRYFFKLYALNAVLPTDAILNKDDLMNAMDGRILDQAELLGTFSKN